MFLTRTELIELTGYKQPRKQALALAEMGIKFFIRADGKPIVAESALRGNPIKKTQKPNLGALNG